MEKLNGKLSFTIELKTIDVNLVTNLIHLEEGTTNIDKTTTEDNVYIVIENEVKNQRLKGKVQDIELYDMNGHLIACDDKNNRGKLKFIIDKF